MLDIEVLHMRMHTKPSRGLIDTAMHAQEATECCCTCCDTSNTVLGFAQGLNPACSPSRAPAAGAAAMSHALHGLCTALHELCSCRLATVYFGRKLTTRLRRIFFRRKSKL